MVFGSVDVRPRSRVKDEIRVDFGRLHRDVEHVPTERLGLGKDLRQGLAELPAGARDQDRSRAERIGSHVLHR